jgi:hypothetical protein
LPVRRLVAARVAVLAAARVAAAASRLTTVLHRRVSDAQHAGVRSWLTPPAVVARSRGRHHQVDALNLKGGAVHVSVGGWQDDAVWTIQFPSNFDPTKKYPTLIPVYGGPASGSNVPTENFANSNAMAEYGFLIVNLSSRSAPGQGKRMLDQIYMKLGTVEMDDMASSVRRCGRVRISTRSASASTARRTVARRRR